MAFFSSNQNTQFWNIVPFYSNFKFYFGVPVTVEKLLCLDVACQPVPVFDEVICDGGWEGREHIWTTYPFHIITAWSTDIFCKIFHEKVFLREKRIEF